jgi:zinc/manganese transport system substrate-binding protein
MITVMVMEKFDRPSRSRHTSPRSKRWVFIFITVSLATFGVAALSTTPQPAGASRHGNVVEVVAAENFWGNITSQLGGSNVAVTSLITNPNADPHLFETDALDAAKLAQARVVIENGAGYDGWMRSLLGADSGNPTVITVANVLHITGSDPNPHLWYDIPQIPKVAGAIAAALSRADPGAAPAIRRNLARFNASLDPLTSVLSTIRSDFAQAPVAYTERVPGYALAVAHLSVKTPPGFARAVEDGVDPGPADTLAMEQLITKHRIDVLLYNTQTVTPVTTQIRALAEKNGVAVVGVSETMPPSAHTYQRWQLSQLTALLHALQHATHTS